MNYTEIKKNMTQGEWTYSDAANDWRRGFLWIITQDGQVIAEISPGDDQDFLANAHAILTAVKNTYGKGIDPEAVPLMKIALEEWKRQIEKVISWGNAFLGEKFDEKMQRNLLKQCEQALAMAKGKE